MNLKNLSDDMLLVQTKSLVAEERRVLTQVLCHLREVERRRLHAALGFSSLFEYCVKELGYAEASAQRRIASMRLLKEMPEIESKIEKGTLSLSVISQAQTFFRNEKILNKKEILELLENKSSREAEKILVSMSTQPMVQERVRAISETHSEVKFIASEELFRDLEKLKGLLAHKHPHASMAELIGVAVKLAVQKLNPAEKIQKPLPPQKPTRVINQALKTLIWKRDQGRCQYKDPKSGKRCTSQHALEIDHIQPFALGGPTTEENLRLLCRAHNAYEAQKVFGEWKLASPRSDLPARNCEL